jgi:hypothetical protein
MPAGHGVGLSIRKKLVRTLPKQLTRAQSDVQLTPSLVSFDMIQSLGLGTYLSGVNKVPNGIMLH